MLRLRTILSAAAAIAITSTVALAVQGTLSSYTVFTSIGDVIFNKSTLAYINGPPSRLLALPDALSDAGVAITATPTGGAVGVSRTAGTSLTLLGEVTSSNAKTDKALFVFNLSGNYIAGTSIPVTINASVAGSGTLTGASTTMTVTAYTEVNGVETALTVSAAQPIVAAGSNLVFTITGTGLTPGAQVAVELAMLVTTASGANTGTINSITVGG